MLPTLTSLLITYSASPRFCLLGKEIDKQLYRGPHEFHVRQVYRAESNACDACS